MPEPSKSTTLRKRLFGSQAVLGLFGILLVNLSLAIFKPLAKVDPESLPSAHTWVWWATHEFLQQKTCPELILMGSSLVMHPVSRRDADYLSTDIDYVKHHKSIYLEDLLKKKFGLAAVRCFNFALPGGMMSDNCMIARALFSATRKPRVVVLGLSLRDFTDAGVKCAGSTPAFKYLRRFTDISDIVDLAMPQIWQRLDFYAGDLLYLWGKKLDAQVVLSQAVKTSLSPIVKQLCLPSAIDAQDASRNLPSNMRAEVEEGQFIVKAHQSYSYEDNSKEYKKRYRSRDLDRFTTQERFFEHMLDLCHSLDIGVLVLNMPLTRTNMKLMPEGFYTRYTRVLERAAASGKCAYLDLNASDQFAARYFYDTSHMNGDGGRKFIDTICDALSGSRLAQRLKCDTYPIASQGKTY